MSSRPVVLPDVTGIAAKSIPCDVTETVSEPASSRPSLLPSLGLDGGAQEPLPNPSSFHFGHTPASATIRSNAQKHPGSSKAPAATPAATSAALATGDGFDSADRPRIEEGRVLNFEAPEEMQGQVGSGVDRAVLTATQAAAAIPATQALPFFLEPTQVQIIPETQAIFEEEGAEEAQEAGAEGLAPAAAAAAAAASEPKEQPAGESEDIDICNPEEAAAALPSIEPQGIAAGATAPAAPAPSAPLSSWDLQRLVDYWLGTAPATGITAPGSEGDGAPTVAPSTMPVSSLHGLAAEFDALLQEWNEGVLEGDEGAYLRINILSNLSHEVARAFFGDGAEGRLDARGALAEFSRALGLALWQLETRDVDIDAEWVKERFPRLPAQLLPPAAGARAPTPQLIENLSFSAAEDAGPAVDDAEELGALSEADEAQIQGLLCLKEEAAEREAAAMAAEAAGGDWKVSMRPNKPSGTPFTEEELAAKLAERLRAASLAPAAPAAGPSSGKAPAAEDNPDALEVEPTLTPSPGDATGPADGADGPHELQVDLTAVVATATDGAQAAKSGEPRPLPVVIGSEPVQLVPPVTETDTTADLPLALGINRGGVDIEAAAGAGAQDRRAVLEESGSLPKGPGGFGFLVGGWGPPPAAAGAAAAAVAASPEGVSPGAVSDQATPSEMWRKHAGGVGAGGPTTAVPETQQERLTARKAAGGSGAAAAAAVAAAQEQQGPAAQLLSVIPATEDEEELEGRTDPAAFAPVACSVAPATAEDVAAAAATPAAAPAEQQTVLFDVDLASQPVGSQEVRAAMQITGLLVDDLSAGGGASQLESDIPLGTPSAARILAGGLMKAPPPRKSSRLAPAAAQPELPAAEAPGAAEEAPAGPAEPPPRGHRASKRDKNASRRKEMFHKVMAPKGLPRPDLGGGAPLVVAKKPAAAAAAAAAPTAAVDGDKQAETPAAAGAEPSMTATGRRSGGGGGAGDLQRILFSGLHDTADCFEMEAPPETAPGGEEGTAQRGGAAGQQAVEKGQEVDSPQRRAPHRATPRLAALAGTKKKGTAGKGAKKTPAPPKAPMPAAAAAAGTLAGDGTRPFDFPVAAGADASLEPMPKPTRRSPRRNAAAESNAAAAAAPPAAPEPYKPAPIREVVGGLLKTLRPHPMLQTAPDASMDFEFEVEAAVPGANGEAAAAAAAAVAAAVAAPVAAQVATEVAVQRRVSPRKRKNEAAAADVTPVAPAAAKRPRTRRASDNMVAAPGGEPGGGLTADSEDQTIQQRWLSTVSKRRASRGRTPQEAPPAAPAAEGDEVPMRPDPASPAPMTSPQRPRRAAAVAAAEKMTPQKKTRVEMAIPLPPGTKVGCPKCRYLATGCSQCRTAAAKRLAAAGVAVPAAGAQQAAPGRGRVLAALGPNRSPAKGARTATRAAKAAAAAAVAAAPPDSPHARPLLGKTFLVSLSSSSADKAEIEATITALGGRVLPDVPEGPPPPSPGARRESTGHRSVREPPRVDAVVADRMGRRSKCVFAVMKGLPVVSREWVAAVKAGRPAPAWTGPWLLRPAAPESETPVFTGRRVLLRCAPESARELRVLLRHAGATLANALRQPGAAGTPLCDLVVVDEAAVGGIVDRAAAVGVPVYSSTWVIDALMAGHLPADWAGTRAPSGAGEKENHEILPTEEVQRSLEFEEAGAGAGGSGGGAEPVAAAVATAAVEAPATGRTARRSLRLAGEPMSPEAEAPVAPTAGRRSPAGRKRLRDASPSALPAAKPTQRRKSTVSPATAAAPAASADATFVWEGTPVAPPHGTAHSAAARRYYTSVMINGRRVALGSFVELAPAPGEVSTRIARVEALWAERGVSGGDRPLGKFQRFFRPEDTPLALAFLGSTQIFRSTVEETASLAAVVRPCAVAFPGSKEELERATQGADYVCTMQYDQESCVLTCLPPQ